MMRTETVLLTALLNQERESLPVPTWKVTIRVPFSAPPRESQEEPPSPFSRCMEERDMLLLVSKTKQDLSRFLSKALPEHPSMMTQLRMTDDRVFLLAGAVSVSNMGSPEKAQAEAVAQQWRERGIPCTVEAVLPEKPALYGYEVLGDAKADHKGLFALDGEREPMTLSRYLEGAEERKADRANKAVERIFSELEGKGLAVRCYGAFLWQQWDGIALTKAGIEYARSLRSQMEQAARNKSDFFLLRCWACGEAYYKTNALFDPAKEPTGAMFDLLPAYGPDGENWTGFSTDATAERLCCPACESPYVTNASVNGNFLREGVLVPPSELQKAA
ncbi:MAG: hypothetical protein C4576_16010 [Desulfobacteraceae bacterium]|nr:MAG: hypothetical protein C4576_16010 [Desulfobacteraceae bacterium]